jgi:hypothetical protein
MNGIPQFRAFDFHYTSLFIHPSQQMTAISKELNRKGLFKDSYTIEYALRITERHIHKHQILSVRCLFCIYLGRENKPGKTRLRQSTANVKDWNGRFRIEKFRNHHER